MSFVVAGGTIIVLLGVAMLAYFGLRDVGRRKATEGRYTWRSSVTVLAILLAAVAAVLFVVYALRNIVVGGDPNIGRFTLRCIRIGNYVSLGAVILSLPAKGRGRWAAFVGGALMLLLWIAQAISL